MIDDSGLPTPIDTGHRRLSTLDQLADIPEEEIWLQKQKSARTRRAYRLDVQHFMRTLAITTPDGTAPGRPQGGDRLGALHARDRARRVVDDPPAARGAVLALQASGAARPRGAQPGRRGRAAGDQSRRRLDPRLRESAGAQTARRCRRRTRSPACATARSCRSACRSGCGAPRSPRSRSAICTRTAAMTRCA